MKNPAPDRNSREALQRNLAGIAASLKVQARFEGDQLELIYKKVIKGEDGKPVQVDDIARYDWRHIEGDVFSLNGNVFSGEHWGFENKVPKGARRSEMSDGHMTTVRSEYIDPAKQFENAIIFARKDPYHFRSRFTEYMQPFQSLPTQNPDNIKSAAIKEQIVGTRIFLDEAQRRKQIGLKQNPEHVSIASSFEKKSGSWAFAKGMMVGDNVSDIVMQHTDNGVARQTFSTIHAVTVTSPGYIRNMAGGFDNGEETSVGSDAGKSDASKTFGIYGTDDSVKKLKKSPYKMSKRFRSPRETLMPRTIESENVKFVKNGATNIAYLKNGVGAGAAIASTTLAESFGITPVSRKEFEIPGSVDLRDFKLSLDPQQTMFHGDHQMNFIMDGRSLDIATIGAEKISTGPTGYQGTMVDPKTMELSLGYDDKTVRMLTRSFPHLATSIESGFSKEAYINKAGHGARYAVMEEVRALMDPLGISVTFGGDRYGQTSLVADTYRIAAARADKGRSGKSYYTNHPTLSKALDTISVMGGYSLDDEKLSDRTGLMRGLIATTDSRFSAVKAQFIEDQKSMGEEKALDRAIDTLDTLDFRKNFITSGGGSLEDYGGDDNIPYFAPIFNRGITTEYGTKKENAMSLDVFNALQRQSPKLAEMVRQRAANRVNPYAEIHWAIQGHPAAPLAAPKTGLQVTYDQDMGPGGINAALSQLEDQTGDKARSVEGASLPSPAAMRNFTSNSDLISYYMAAHGIGKVTPYGADEPLTPAGAAREFGNIAFDKFMDSKATEFKKNIVSLDIGKGTYNEYTIHNRGVDEFEFGPDVAQRWAEQMGISQSELVNRSQKGLIAMGMRVPFVGQQMSFGKFFYNPDINGFATSREYSIAHQGDLDGDKMNAWLLSLDGNNEDPEFLAEVNKAYENYVASGGTEAAALKTLYSHGGERSFNAHLEMVKASMPGATSAEIRRAMLRGATLKDGTKIEGYNPKIGNPKLGNKGSANPMLEAEQDTAEKFKNGLGGVYKTQKHEINYSESAQASITFADKKKQMSNKNMLDILDRQFSGNESAFNIAFAGLGEGFNSITEGAASPADLVRQSMYAAYQVAVDAGNFDSFFAEVSKKFNFEGMRAEDPVARVGPLAKDMAVALAKEQSFPMHALASLMATGDTDEEKAASMQQHYATLMGMQEAGPDHFVRLTVPEGSALWKTAAAAIYSNTRNAAYKSATKMNPEHEEALRAIAGDSIALADVIQRNRQDEESFVENAQKNDPVMSRTLAENAESAGFDLSTKNVNDPAAPQDPSGPSASQSNAEGNGVPPEPQDPSGPSASQSNAESSGMPPEPEWSDREFSESEMPGGAGPSSSSSSSSGSSSAGKSTGGKSTAGGKSTGGKSTGGKSTGGTPPPPKGPPGPDTGPAADPDDGSGGRKKRKSRSYSKKKKPESDLRQHARKALEEVIGGGDVASAIKEARATRASGGTTKFRSALDKLIADHGPGIIPEYRAVAAEMGIKTREGKSGVYHDYLGSEKAGDPADAMSDATARPSRKRATSTVGKSVKIDPESIEAIGAATASALAGASQIGADPRRPSSVGGGQYDFAIGPKYVATGPEMSLILREMIDEDGNYTGKRLSDILGEGDFGKLYRAAGTSEQALLDEADEFLSQEMAPGKRRAFRRRLRHQAGGRLDTSHERSGPLNSRLSALEHMLNDVELNGYQPSADMKAKLDLVDEAMGSIASTGDAPLKETAAAMTAAVDQAAEFMNRHGGGTTFKNVDEARAIMAEGQRISGEVNARASDLMQASGNVSGVRQAALAARGLSGGVDALTSRTGTLGRQAEAQFGAGFFAKQSPTGLNALGLLMDPAGSFSGVSLTDALTDEGTRSSYRNATADERTLMDDADEFLQGNMSPSKKRSFSKRIRHQLMARKDGTTPEDTEATRTLSLLAGQVDASIAVDNSRDQKGMGLLSEMMDSTGAATGARIDTLIKDPAHRESYLGASAETRSLVEDTDEYLSGKMSTGRLRAFHQRVRYQLAAKTGSASPQDQEAAVRLGHLRDSVAADMDKNGVKPTGLDTLHQLIDNKTGAPTGVSLDYALTDKAVRGSYQSATTDERALIDDVDEFLKGGMSTPKMKAMGKRIRHHLAARKDGTTPEDIEATKTLSLLANQVDASLAKEESKDRWGMGLLSEMIDPSGAATNVGINDLIKDPAHRHSYVNASSEVKSLVEDVDEYLGGKMSPGKMRSLHQRVRRERASRVGSSVPADQEAAIRLGHVEEKLAKDMDKKGIKPSGLMTPLSAMLDKNGASTGVRLDDALTANPDMLADYGESDASEQGFMEESDEFLSSGMSLRRMQSFANKVRRQIAKRHTPSTPQEQELFDKLAGLYGNVQSSIAKEAQKATPQKNIAFVADSISKLQNLSDPAFKEAAAALSAATKKAADFMEKYGENGKEVIDSQEKMAAVIKEGVEIQKELNNRASDIGKFGGRDPGVKDVVKGARGLSAGISSMVSESGSIGEEAILRYGEDFHEKSVNQGFGNKGVKALNRMLSGYFAFQALRDIRYTFNPVIDNARQFNAQQMGENAMLSNAGLGMPSNQLSGARGMNALADIRYGMGIPAAAMMNGIGMMFGGSSAAQIGTGPLGVGAAIGLPALGVAGIAGLTMSQLGAAGFATAGVLAPTVAIAAGIGTAIAGGAGYIRGARQDGSAMLRYAAGGGGINDLTAELAGGAMQEYLSVGVKKPSFIDDLMNAPGHAPAVRFGGQLQPEDGYNPTVRFDNPLMGGLEVGTQRFTLYEILNPPPQDSKHPIASMGADVPFMNIWRDQDAAKDKEESAIRNSGIAKYAMENSARLKKMSRENPMDADDPMAARAMLETVDDDGSASGGKPSALNKLKTEYGLTSEGTRSIAAMAMSYGMKGDAGQALLNRLAAYTQTGGDPSKAMEAYTQIAAVRGNFDPQAGAVGFASDLNPFANLNSNMATAASLNLAGGVSSSTALVRGGLAPSTFAAANMMGGYMDRNGRFDVMTGEGFSEMAQFAQNYRLTSGQIMPQKYQDLIARAGFQGYKAGDMDQSIRRFMAANDITDPRQIEKSMDGFLKGGMSLLNKPTMSPQGLVPFDPIKAMVSANAYSGAIEAAGGPGGSALAMKFLGTNAAGLQSIFGSTGGAALLEAVGGGNPETLTRLMASGQMSTSFTGGALTDITTGAGLFQKSMFGLYGASKPSDGMVSRWLEANAQALSKGSRSPSLNPAGSVFNRRMTDAMMGNTFAIDGQKVGGVTALNLLSNQANYEATTASAGIQMAQIQEGFRYFSQVQMPSQRSEFGMDKARMLGGFYQDDFMKKRGIPGVDFGVGQFERQRQSMGREIAGMFAEQRNTMTRFGWQAEDTNREQYRTNIQNDWQREDFGLRSQSMRLGRNFQMYQFAYQANDMQLQKRYASEDFAFNRNVSNLQFGWQMEDFDTNIRRSTGFQRRQIIKDRDRAVEMRNLEVGQEDKLKSRQDESFKRQEEYFKRQVEHYKSTQKMEDREFENQKKRFDQQVKWRDEDFNVRRGRLNEEMRMSKEAFDRQMENMKVKQEELDIEQSMFISNAERKTVAMSDEEAHQIKMKDLSLASAGAAAKHALEMKNISDAYEGIKLKEENRFLNLEKLVKDVSWDRVKAAVDTFIQWSVILNNSGANNSAGKNYAGPPSPGTSSPNPFDSGGSDGNPLTPYLIRPAPQIEDTGSSGKQVVMVMLDGEAIAKGVFKKGKNVVTLDARRSY